MRSGSTSERPLEEVDRGEQVLLGAAPAERVRIPVAASFAATVEDQHAVAVAGQHPRGRLRHESVARKFTKPATISSGLNRRAGRRAHAITPQTT